VRAIVLHETGGPDVLRLEDVPEPEAAEGQLLIRVEAAGVNHYDLNQRAGGATGLPKILGSDAGGTTEDGTRVLVTGAQGAYAEKTVAAAERVFPIPESVSMAAAAAIGVPYRTAWWALVDVARLAEGDTLLVQAGSSATGQACVDIGRALGATVYATASTRKLDRVAELGATALAYDDPQIAELAADVVFDPVGASTFERSVDALGRGGRIVTPGAVGDPRVSFDIGALMSKRGEILGTGSAPIVREAIERLIALAAEGRIRPVIDRELPLDEAAEAPRAIEARETFGKVILRP
jgi:NADPH:quinone reductase-like Zn-dependent oxidoreductase